MKIGMFLSNWGGSPLQGGLERGLCALGHDVVLYHPGRTDDLILMFNQTAHRQDYRYPPMPDPKIPVAFIDSAEYGYFKRLPGVVHQYANTFSPAAMTHDTKNQQEQQRLKTFLEGKSFPYFLREHSIYIDFPLSYHPIDYPLYWLSDEIREPDREEYLKRDLDLFVSWGASHPWRLHLTEALRNAHTKCEISVIEEMVNGKQTPRMDQRLYFDRTRAAKCSVSFDGYGSGSFRVTEVLVRCLLLQGPLTIRRHKPLIDGVHCIEYQIQTEGETYLSSNIQECLWNALRDTERSFRIYEAGYHHCRENYSEKATAQYVLDTVASHDWKVPTPLDL